VRATGIPRPLRNTLIEHSNSVGYETTVDYKVAPGKRPSVIAVYGPVTSKPGPYELRIGLLANVPGHTDPHQFREGIPVRVVAGNES
jgi:hypothetical protein